MDQANDRAAREASSGLKVMVVDDDSELREAVKLQLEDRQHQVQCYASGRDALAALRSATNPPDVIVLDLQMPEMDGWQFRVEQRQSPEGAAIPVIVMSGDHSAKAKAIDAAAYLTKPIEAEELADTVERIAQEVQRRKRLARATQIELLISLGSLVGGIAHEINNPLSLVFGSIDVLQRQLLGLAAPEQASEPFSIAKAFRVLKTARKNLQRIAEVVQCVSLFASADVECIEDIDVYQVLESSIQVASNEIRHAAHLVRSYAPVRLVRGNPAKLGQVILNLLLNAVSAIREHGGSDHVIRVATTVEEDRVVISLTDSATSFAAGAAAGLLDPLAENSMSYGRLHFGLAINREVIQEMGGTIDLRAIEPRGMAVRIELPATTRESVLPPEPRPPVELLPTRATIAVIDDEPLIGELFAAVLSAHYEVSTFSSSREALTAVRAARFDVIICDVMMPELNGVDLFELATRDRPELRERFVFVTGGAFTDRARLFLRQTGRPVLRKPCTQQALKDVVASIVAAGAVLRR